VSPPVGRVGHAEGGKFGLYLIKEHQGCRGATFSCEGRKTNNCRGKMRRNRNRRLFIAGTLPLRGQGARTGFASEKQRGLTHSMCEKKKRKKDERQARPQSLLWTASQKTKSRKEGSPIRGKKEKLSLGKGKGGELVPEKFEKPQNNDRSSPVTKLNRKGGKRANTRTEGNSFMKACWGQDETREGHSSWLPLSTFGPRRNANAKKTCTRARLPLVAT